MPDNSRLLSDPYDGERQRHFAEWDNEDKFQVMLGRLKLDAILYDTILLIDGDLFDGLFFLDAANRNKLDEIPWKNIEVRARVSSLEESFLRSIRKPGQPKLQAYLFSSLEPHLGAKVLRHLEQSDAEKVKDLDDISRVMEEAEVDGTKVDRKITDRFAVGWRRLLDLEKQKKLSVKPWEGDFEFKKHIEAAKDGLLLNTELGAHYLRIIEEKDTIRNRNKVMALLTPHEDHHSDLERQDISTLYTWYNGAYRAAQAEQHDCDIRDIALMKGCRPFGAEFAPNVAFDEPTPSEILQVPPNFLAGLGSAPRKDVADFVRRPGMKEALKLWRTERSTYALRRAMEALIHWVDSNQWMIAAPESPAIPIRNVGVEVAGATLGGVAGFAAGAAIAQKILLDRRWILETGLSVSCTVIGSRVVAPLQRSDPATEIAQTIVTQEKRRHRLS